MSHLWAFSQRQEESKDKDDNLYEISKLRNLINKLVTWYKNGGKSEEIDWNETHKISDIKLIKSEDVEVLISTINLLQGAIGDLFGENLQGGYHFFESVKTGIITTPKKIEYTLPYTINKENLLSELNHSIEPELLTTISLRGNKGSHSISVYMKKDGKIIFYDPNLGEFDCATDMNKLVDLIATGPSIKQQIQLFLGYISNNKPSYMQILKIFIKEGIMKYFTPNKYNNFFIETWYFGKNEALEKKSLDHAKKYIRSKMETASIKTEEELSSEHIKALTSLEADWLAKDCPKSYRELLAKADKLSPERIKTLTSFEAGWLVKDCPKLYIELLDKADKLSLEHIKELTSFETHFLATNSLESYKELLARADKISPEQIKELTSLDALRLAKDCPKSYRELLAKAEELSPEHIKALTFTYTYAFATNAPELYKEMLDKAEELSPKRIKELSSLDALSLAIGSAESYKELLAKAEALLSPEQIKELTSLDALRLAIGSAESYKELLDKADKLSLEHIKELTSFETHFLATNFLATNFLESYKELLQKALEADGMDNVDMDVAGGNTNLAFEGS